MSDERACALCSLDVGSNPFVLRNGEQQVQFCCEGCRGIYQMLHDIKETPAANGQVDDPKQ